MAEATRIMVAVEHLLFGECLALALRTREGLEAVALTLDGQWAIDVGWSVKAASAYRPDVVLIDFNLDNGKAFELAQSIRLELPATRLILFNLAGHEPVILKCIESGADGYLSKFTSLDELVAAIHSVGRGEKFCSPQITYALLTKLTDLTLSSTNRLPQHFSLSPREVEVLRLVGRGLSNKQIAQQLRLSLYTVKNHVHNILEKLEVNNRSAMILYALDNGLIKTGKD